MKKSKSIVSVRAKELFRLSLNQPKNENKSVYDKNDDDDDAAAAADVEAFSSFDNNATTSSAHHEKKNVSDDLNYSLTLTNIFGTKFSTSNNVVITIPTTNTF